MFGDSANLEHTQRCDHLLAETHPLVQTHNEFLELSTEGLSPQDVELISKQRVHFLDHIRISVGHLESLIEHQQALVNIISRPSGELSTGVPVVYPDELPTAHRVPGTCVVVRRRSAVERRAVRRHGTNHKTYR